MCVYVCVLSWRVKVKVSALSRTLTHTLTNTLTHTHARARLLINNSTRTSLGEQLEQLLLPSAPTTTTTKRRNRLELSSLLLLTVLPAGSDWLARPDQLFRSHLMKISSFKRDTERDGRWGFHIFSHFCSLWQNEPHMYYSEIFYHLFKLLLKQQKQV